MVASSSTMAEVPISCNPQVFSKEELDEHLSVAMDVLFRLPKNRQELPDGFLFEYQGNEALFLKVARFAYNEHRCCPWESFAIEMEPFAAGTDGVIRLRYIGGPEGKPIIAEALEQFEVAAHDPAALERLKAALSGFSQITADNKASFYEKVSGKSGGFMSKLKSACGC